MHAELPRNDVHQVPDSLLVDVHGGDDTQAPRIAVAGEVDMLTAPAVQEAVVDVLHHRHPRRIEIDLRGVTFLDSAGIRTLLMCHADARQEDCLLTVVDPHPRVYRVLQITGLLGFFALAADPAASDRDTSAVAVPVQKVPR
jgi:anti-anti-sigma factor